MAPKKRSKSATSTAAAAAEDGAAASEGKRAKTIKTAKEPQTERDPTPRRPVPEGHGRFTVCSWNVDGLRGQGRREDLAVLLREERPDVVCLQETKLQEQHVQEFADLLPGYDAYWSCSTAKKGYAGTACFVKASGSGDVPCSGPGVRVPAQASGSAQATLKSFFGKGKRKAAEVAEDEEAPPSTAAAMETDAGGSAPLPVRRVTFGIGHDKHDTEGRSVTLEFDHLFVVNLYVPNSGQKLERLKYRLEEWNPDLEAYVRELEERKPVVVLGDLNVAHREVDIYNYWASHLKKQPGCTMAERDAFTAWLERGYFDSLRHLHGDARGQYTYWSGRSKTARQDNTGLRLDYFVCSQMLSADDPGASAAKVVDSYTLHDKTASSDHGPCMLVLGLAA